MIAQKANKQTKARKPNQKQPQQKLLQPCIRQGRPMEDNVQEYNMERGVASQPSHS